MKGRWTAWRSRRFAACSRARTGGGSRERNLAQNCLYRIEVPGNARVLIGDDGDVRIPDSFRRHGRRQRILFLKFGIRRRAREFLKQRIEDSRFRDNYVSSFTVPRVLCASDARRRCTSARPENERGVFVGEACHRSRMPGRRRISSGLRTTGSTDYDRQ